MQLDFTAIDFETANSSPASPCSVGMVRVRSGKIVESSAFLIKPPMPHDWFSEFNIKVHGITPKQVEDAPDLDEALKQMLEFIGDDVLIAHNASFDMGVLSASANHIGYSLPRINFICSLLIARKTYHLDSYNLRQVCYAIGHEEFNHHDALADSDACARIVIHAANRHGAEDLMSLLKITKLKLRQLG